MTFAPGDMLTSQLELIEPIGAGAMGSVWVAEDRTLERRVAVKLIAADLRSRTEAVVRFRREASLAAKIKSPHVVEIYGHGVTDEGAPYMTMELLEGASLATRVDQGAISIAEAREIIAQLARALAAAHALQVIHRDIKPANVFLVDAPGYEVFVKVVDFGIAKQLSREEGLTATGAVIGTPWFMSPEQLMSSKDVDHRADLWATAIMAYQLLSGQMPFPGDTIGAVVLAVSKGVFPPVSERVPSLGAPLDRWFERAFLPDVDDRFQSADELATSFAAACDGAGDESAVAASPSEPVDGGAATEEFIAQQGLAVDGAGRPTSVEAATADGEAKTDGALAEPASPDATRPLRQRVLLPAVGLAAAAAIGLGLLTLAREPASPPAAPPPTRGAALSAAPTEPQGSAATAGSSHKPRPPGSRHSGRIPLSHIQDVIRRHFDTLANCRDEQATPRAAVVRSLRFTINTEGTPEDVHVAELDPSAPRFDQCLVDKFSKMRFQPPTGGVVTVTYPIVFSEDDSPPLADSACAMTPGCSTVGRCSAKDGACVVAKDDDCALARVCTQRGQCIADGPRCVAGSEGGPQTEPCKRYGLCAKDGDRGAAATDAQCEASKACKSYGLCTANNGVCVADDDEHCRRSTDCKRAGNCEIGHGWCVARTDEHCKRSDHCDSYGWCSHRFEHCTAMSDEDCRGAGACREQGRCSADGLGRCVATSDADCRRSERCDQQGMCFEVEGFCMGERLEHKP